MKKEKQERIRIFARLVKQPEVESFDWALSAKVIKWLYQMRNNPEIARVLWVIIGGEKK